MTRPRSANGGCLKNLKEQVLLASGEHSLETAVLLLAVLFTTEKQELSRDIERLTRRISNININHSSSKVCIKSRLYCSFARCG